MKRLQSCQVFQLVPFARYLQVLQSSETYADANNDPLHGNVNGTMYQYGYLADGEIDGIAYQDGLPFNETAFKYMTKPQGQYTIEDYDQLPEDSFVELIDGVLYDLSGPSVTHQIIATELWLRLKLFIQSNKGPCLPIIAPCDVILRKEDTMTVVQPDVFVVCDKSKIIGGRIEGAVDLAIEVISPSTKKKDFTIKLQKYLEAGTKEYWIVDPDRQKIIVYILENGPDPFIYTFQDTVPVGIFNNQCIVDMKEIWKEIAFLYETE